MKFHLSVFIAILVAALTLIAYFIPLPGLEKLQTRLIDWAIILVGIAMLMGIWNLLKTHWARLNLSFQKKEAKEKNIPGKQTRKPKVRRDIYSLALLIGFFITFLVGFWLTPANLNYQQAVAGIQIPIETTLFALLSIVLLTAAFNFFKFNKTIMGIVFVGSVLIFLLLGGGFLHNMAENEWLKDIIAIINQLPLAGARGILIGLALGSIVTALKQVLGIDRAYRE